MKHAIYDNDGRVVGFVETTAESQDGEPTAFKVEHQEHKQFMKVGHDITDLDSHHMVSGKLVRRKKFPKKFDKTTLRSGETATMHNPPKGTIVNGQPVLEDDVIHVVGYAPGVYTVTLEAFPYRNLEATFNVVDSRA